MEPTEVKVDKRTKEYREGVKIPIDRAVTDELDVFDNTSKVDRGKEPYAKIENNPGFKLCMMCGTELPPNEDGTPKWRKYPEPCSDCIWRNK